VIYWLKVKGVAAEWTSDTESTGAVGWQSAAWVYSHLGDKPSGRQPTGRHFSVNWATQLWLLRGQCRKCNI